MLFSNYDITGLLLPRDKFFPFPKAGAFKPGRETAAQAEKNADMYKDNDWGSLSASLYMQFAETGNRVNYEDVCFRRRIALANLVAGEYALNDGRYIRDIINGIWALCEESSWTVPAHNFGGALPDTENPIVDLFAAQTAALAALTVYLLRDRLDKVCREICVRAEREIKKRVTLPILKNNYWWMGFGSDRREKPSNWTAWCSSTCLTACLLSETDEKVRAGAVKKLIEVMEYYISAYADDGGCDEGTEYWGMSAGCMFDFLEMLMRATDGKVNIFDNEKIRRMGEYIADMHIDGDYFVNFADCGAKIETFGARTYLFGLRTGSERLTAYGAYEYRRKKDRLLSGSMNLLHKLFAAETEVPQESGYRAEKRVYIKSLQMLVSRSEDFTLIAKGGNNGDNHNHNDVGNYIVYMDGLPVIIDAGVESYSKKTFGSERYDIWTMQSAYHNLPTVNGVMQHEGAEFKASNILVGSYSMRCDIKDAYPPESGIRLWNRMATAENGCVTVKDDFSLSAATDDIKISVMLWKKPVLGKNCVKSGAAGIYYLSEQWKAEFEEIYVGDDAKLAPVWGDCIYRAVFTPVQPVKTGSFKISIRRL